MHRIKLTHGEQQIRKELNFWPLCFITILKCSSFEEEEWENLKYWFFQNAVFKYSNKDQNYG